MPIWLRVLGSPRSLAAILSLTLSLTDAAVPCSGGADRAATGGAVVAQIQTLIVQDRLTEAAEMVDAALARTEGRPGVDRDGLADLLTMKGRLAAAFGDHDQAWPIFQRSLAIETELHGLSHPESVCPLLGLASIRNVRGEFAEAEAQYRLGLDLLRPVLEPTHPLISEAVVGLATCLANLGDYPGAELELQRRLAVVTPALGENNVQVGELMLNLADVMNMLGEEVESTRLFRRAASIMEKAVGPDHSRTAAALSGLAHTMRRVGRDPEAKALYRRCIQIVNDKYGDYHPNLIHYQCRLGMTMMSLHEHEEALAWIQRGVALARDIYGGDSYQVALEERHLGIALYSLRRSDEARAVFARSLATLEHYFGPQHPFLAKCLKGFSLTCKRLGSIEDALAYVKRAVSIHERSAGRDQFELSVLLRQQADIEMVAGLADAAVASAMRSVEAAMALHEQGYRVNSEREAALLAFNARYSARELLTVASDHPALPDTTLDRVFSYAARNHGMVLDRLAERRRFLETVEDSVKVELSWGDFASATQRVADLLVRGPGKEAAAYQKELATARRDRERAERALAEASERLLSAAVPAASGDEITAGTLADALPAGATLVHFARYNKRRPEKAGMRKQGMYYGAFCLHKWRSGSRELSFVELGLCRHVDSLVTAHRRSIEDVDVGRRPTAREEAEYRAIARRLHDTVWAPLSIMPEARLAEDLTDAAPSIVFLIPVSWLHLLDFNTLMTPRGELVIERYRLHLLSSGRDLLRPPARHRTGAGLLAVGDPAGDFSDEDRLTQSAFNARTRSVLRLCADERQPCPLPGAAKEARDVADLFAAATGEPATVLTGLEATEETVKLRLAGNRMVHFAVHGFFCESQEKDRAPMAEQLMEPLLTSGLLLAATERDDGLLTAQELSCLDLSSLDWVVLSACGSGLGKLIWGEGLYGLRRAFEMAGAGTVVMTLWRLDDLNTRRLMANIYRLRLAGCSTIDAIRQAQLDRLQDQKRRFNRLHPALWGGIIAEGAWR